MVLVAVAIGGTGLLFAKVLREEYTKDTVLARMHLMRASSRAVVHRTPPAAAPMPAAGESQLDLIRARRALRIGYLPQALPFAFFNERGDLVGFDIELAHDLSLELGVAPEFVPVDRATLAEQLSNGYCDIVMSGTAVTTDRASTTLFSSSYLDETVALLVPDHLRQQYASWDAIRDLGDITIAVPDVPYYIARLHDLAPHARIRIVPDIGSALAAQERPFDAFALPAERGSAWSLIHPRFSVVVPEPGVMKVPLAYPLARHDVAFASFVNTWIDLKRKDGTIDARYRYWILGQASTPHEPRWSILRDVLHWVR
jgi:ABC-type amino acid transport substrate-binding protein